MGSCAVPPPVPSFFRSLDYSALFLISFKNFAVFHFSGCPVSPPVDLLSVLPCWYDSLASTCVFFFFFFLCAEGS